MSQDIKRQLKGFSALAKAHPGAIADSVSFGEEGGQHHYFTFCLHGDEVGSLPGVLRAAADLLNGEIKPKGKVTFTLGNRAAIEEGVRFINSDMNRCFKAGLYFNSEEERAAEILSDLATATHIIDFHQTIEPTLGPFYVYSNDADSRAFAKSLNVAEYAIVLGQEQDEFEATLIAAGTRLETPAVTIELSQLGLAKEAEDLCYETIKSIVTGQPLEAKELKEYALAEFIPLNDSEDHLRDGFKNFESVHKSEVIGHRKNGENIVSDHEGVIIFPKYKLENVTNEEKRMPDNIAVIAVEADPESLK